MTDPNDQSDSLSPEAERIVEHFENLIKNKLESRKRLIEDAGPLAERLAGEQVASQLAAQDPTLWGPDAESEASIRLSWTTLHETSRPLVAEIEALRLELAADGVDRVVLAGMGGSSLAPEVITRTAGVPLVVLDTTDPGQVADALAGDLSRTVLVVSSKSGSTVETDSHRRIFEKAFAEEGIDAASRIVVVTDPGSPLEEASKAAGYRRVFAADPHVGGRYSALTAFGLVPSGLAGADIGRAARRRGRGRRLPRRGQRGQPGAAAGRRARRRARAGRGEGGHRRHRLRHQGLRRLGRAADRRVHRQERHRPAAGRGREPGGSPASPTRTRTRRRSPSGRPPTAR